MIDIEDWGPSKKTIKIAENSWFFARLETRKEKVWMVWGNPNCKKYNETLINEKDLRNLRDSLCEYFYQSR